MASLRRVGRGRPNGRLVEGEVVLIQHRVVGQWPTTREPCQADPRTSPKSRVR